MDDVSSLVYINVVARKEQGSSHDETCEVLADQEKLPLPIQAII